MLKFAILLVSSLSASIAFSAEIRDGRYNVQAQAIELDVVYGGGCGEHTFDLKVGACQESFPVSCSVKLLHSSQDFCEALVSETIQLPLEKVGLNDGYYSNGSVTIKGDNKSQVTIELPALPLSSSTEPASLNSFQISGARWDAKKKAIAVDVSYGGGCFKHKYDLKLNHGCAETFPVQCDLLMSDVSKEADVCEALVSETVYFTLKQARLNDSYYSGARLTISEKNGTKATLALPRF